MMAIAKKAEYSNLAQKVKRALLLALSVSFVPLFSFPAFSITPDEVVSLATQNQGKITFTGKRIHRLQRQNLALLANMKIYHQNASNYRVIVSEPAGLAGTNLWLDDNKARVFFPMEGLMFKNDNPTGSYEAASIIFGSITPELSLLKANYNLQLLESGYVAMQPCHVLKLVPKRGYRTPGHTFWISKENGQILKEERTWGEHIDPYFSSYYEEFHPVGMADTAVSVPRGVQTVDLKRQDKNSLMMYRSIADAEAAINGKVPLPSFVPDGFALHNIQFASFFGTRITLLNYTDGANWLIISYRPKPNMFVTMMAGAMALNLIEKMNQLSFQAPYNYYATEKSNNLIFAYGDLYPDDLKRVGESMSLK
ncbi:MAG: hypothetical protein ACM3YO_06190 [Bacteroidota bacterium]